MRRGRGVGEALQGTTRCQRPTPLGICEVPGTARHAVPATQYVGPVVRPNTAPWPKLVCIPAGGMGMPAPAPARPCLPPPPPVLHVGSVLRCIASLYCLWYCLCLQVRCHPEGGAGQRQGRHNAAGGLRHAAVHGARAVRLRCVPTAAVVLLLTRTHARMPRVGEWLGAWVGPPSLLPSYPCLWQRPDTGGAPSMSRSLVCKLRATRGPPTMPRRRAVPPTSAVPPVPQAAPWTPPSTSTASACSCGSSPAAGRPSTSSTSPAASSCARSFMAGGLSSQTTCPSRTGAAPRRCAGTSRSVPCGDGGEGGAGTAQAGQGGKGLMKGRQRGLQRRAGGGGERRHAAH